MTNFNKTADCIAVPDKVSDAEKLIVNGKDITKDRTVKIICSDPNFLGRSVKLIFPEYAQLSDEEAANRFMQRFGGYAVAGARRNQTPLMLQILRQNTKIKNYLIKFF